MDTLEEIKQILREIALSQKESEEKNRQNFLELHALQKKTDAQLAKTDAQLAKTDAQLAKTDARLSGLGFNYGTHAEEYFYYALDESKKLGNLQFDEVLSNVRPYTKKIKDEFDVVMVNGNSVALIEVKHKVHPKDLQKLMTSKVANFRALMPDFKDYTLYLGIAGFSIPQEIEEEALAKGIAVIRQKGEVVVTSTNHLQAY